MPAKKRLVWCLWSVCLALVPGCADDGTDRSADGEGAGASVAGASGQSTGAGAAGASAGGAGSPAGAAGQGAGGAGAAGASAGAAGQGAGGAGAAGASAGGAGAAGASAGGAGAAGASVGGAGAAGASAGGAGSPAGAAGQGAGGVAGAQGGSAGGAGEPAAPTWSDVYTASLGVCVGCHNGTAESGVRPDLSSGDTAYTTLTTTSSTYCFLTGGSMPYVTPGNPDQSAIYQVVTEGQGCLVARMPKDLAPLSDAQIARIRAWILAGAPP